MTLRETVYNTLRGAVPVPGLYNETADPDAPTPYVVYRISRRPQDPWAIEQATVDIDVIDSSTTAERAEEIASDIEQALDSQHIGQYRFWLDGQIDIPVSERYMWHRSMQFTARYTKDWRIQ